MYDKKILAVIGGASAASLAVGAVGGYFAVKYRLVQKLDEAYNKTMEEELARTRDYYEKREKKGSFATPQDALVAFGGQEIDDSTLLRIAEGLRDMPFDDSNDGPAEDKNWDLKAVEEDLSGDFSEDVEWAEADILEQVVPPTVPEVFMDEDRSPDHPYIISREEFDLHETGYSAQSLTYFELDEVLMDTDKEPIDDVEDVIGQKTLFRFGRKSGDRNIVLVRNDRLQIDYEILRHRGRYDEEVLGHKPKTRERNSRPVVVRGGVRRDADE